MCVILILGMILVRFYERLFHRLLRSHSSSASMEKPNQGVGRPFHSQHLRHYAAALMLIESMILSLMIWIIEGTCFFFCFIKAFSIPLPYAGAFFLLFALGLSVTLPQGPGYVGTFELFGVTALTLLGIPKELGLPMILAIHGTHFIFIAIFGGLGLWKEGLNLQSLSSTT